jgi:hypothetical protein
MEMRHDLQGVDKLQRAFIRAPQFVSRELYGWMQATTLHLQREIQIRTPKREGTLQKSIGSEVEKVGQFGVAGIVGTSLNYAPPVEFGSKPHDIYPKNGKALAFMMRGVPVFAKKVHHPGSKGAFMFTKALEANIKNIEDDFASFIDHVLAKIAAGAV